VLLRHGDGFQIITNEYTGVKLYDGGNAGQQHENFGPILGVRLASGEYTGYSTYNCQTAQPVSSRFELLEEGPVYIAARVTTTFDNDRTHAVTVGLWQASRSIEIEEEFDLGPDDMYKFKQYENDRDELAWEWWQWYGDRLGTFRSNVRCRHRYGRSCPEPIQPAYRQLHKQQLRGNSGRDKPAALWTAVQREDRALPRRRAE